jgi:hypothetical protein
VDVTVFDMMPMTAEVEVAVTLEGTGARPAQGTRA